MIGRPVALAALLMLGACAVAPPSGPTVMALPGPGKSFQVFQQDDYACRQYAAAVGSTQASYNVGYTQCMIARGDTVRSPPVVAEYGYPSGYGYAYPYPYPYAAYPYPYVPYVAGPLIGLGIGFGWGGWHGHHWHDGGWHHGGEWHGGAWHAGGWHGHSGGAWHGGGGWHGGAGHR
jgi:hypothetical protein